MNDGRVSENDAWNPGISSDIPARLMPKVTLFCEKNSIVNYALATELSDLTGIKPLQLVALKPERLMVHALLVRVTSDLSVPDGPNYADLGINLRGMVDRIYQGYIQPDMKHFESVWVQLRDDAQSKIVSALCSALDQPTSTSHPADLPKHWWQRWFNKKQQPVTRSTEEKSLDLLALEHWEKQLSSETDPLSQACLKRLVKAAKVIIGHRGRLLPDRDLMTRIVVNQVSNDHGALLLSQAMEPHWHKAIQTEGYRELPFQAEPLVMNVKGASASGKSTIRPRQRELAEKLGISWEDFALISPDYWRKYLLDYESLGDDFRYGAMLTGREIEIIDKKLDDYMASKAINGTIPHLLIDRFRFDSFVVDIDRSPGSKLLSRFGHRVFLFFLVTHPAETVVRAWERGLKTGRFKAVDDLLYHNIEAYEGMPSLFFSWMNSKDREIHVEFLDNDVPKGELPRTVAFGSNDLLVVLDVSLLLNISQYGKVNLNAGNADEVLPVENRVPSSHTSFIKSCLNKISTIVFADSHSGEYFAIVKQGRLIWWNNAYISDHLNDKLSAILAVLGYNSELDVPALPKDIPQLEVTAEQKLTVGRWGL